MIYKNKHPFKSNQNMNVYYSYYIYEYTYSWEFPCGSAGEESVCNDRDLGLIPGIG